MKIAVAAYFFAGSALAAGDIQGISPGADDEIHLSGAPWRA